MHTLDLVCPECSQLGYQSREVWVPENPSYRLKCRFCGAWSPLEMWTLRLHPSTVALLKLLPVQAKPHTPLAVRAFPALRRSASLH